MRKEPLRRLSLAAGATGLLGLALVAPAFAGANVTPTDSSDGGSWGDWVTAYPIAALMTEVESDEDEVVSGEAADRAECWTVRASIDSTVIG